MKDAIDSKIQGMQAVYSKQFKQHGESPASLFNPKFRQPWRFSNMLKGLQFSSVLDYGCGFAYLREYLHENHCHDLSYVGVDIVEEFLECASRKFPEDHFINDPYLESIGDTFDLTFVSGTFNLVAPGSNHRDQQRFVENSLINLFEKTQGVLVFDFLNEFADFYAENAYYREVHDMVRFVSEKLSPRFEVMQGYMRFESCIRVYKDLETDHQNCFKKRGE